MVPVLAACLQPVEVPAGISYTWSGQYEYKERADARLRILLPVVLAVIFGLLNIINFIAAKRAGECA